MKINFIKTLIAVAISLLIAYGFYSFHESENKFLLSIGGGIFILITLILGLGSSFELSRSTTLIRTVSMIFFGIALTSNLIFSFIKFSVPGYVLTNGLLLLVFCFIEYSIFKAKQ